MEGLKYQGINFLEALLKKKEEAALLGYSVH